MSTGGMHATHVALEQLSIADREYLRDLAAVYLDAGEHTEEEELLERAHALACDRLGIVAVWHLEIALTPTPEK